MDQDSVVDANLMAAYRNAVLGDPGCVCLSPQITASRVRNDAVGGRVSYAITSGNLVRVSVFDQVGLYDEGLFIDCIDFDFCLRLRHAGYAIYRVPAALMRHQLGDPVEVPSALRRYYALHSPLRRYYMYRNFMYLAERYLLEFPFFIVKLGLGQILLLLLMGFLDPSPLSSYRAVARGIGDYALRRKGPYVERVA
jgi:rhamnosyltransferase